jgi:hypothetical protein
MAVQLPQLSAFLVQNQTVATALQGRLRVRSLLHMANDEELRQFTEVWTQCYQNRKMVLLGASSRLANIRQHLLTMFNSLVHTRIIIGTKSGS